MKRADRHPKIKRGRMSPVSKNNDSKDSLSDDPTSFQVPETPCRPVAPIACSTQMRSKIIRRYDFTPMVRNNNNIKSLNANKTTLQIPQTPYRTGIPGAIRRPLRRITPPELFQSSSDELSIIDRCEDINKELQYSEYLRLCMLESKVSTDVDEIDRELTKLRTRVVEAEDELSKMQMEKQKLCELSVMSRDLEKLQSDLEAAVNRSCSASTENVALKNRLKEICDRLPLKNIVVPQDASNDGDILKTLHYAGSSISGLNFARHMRELQDTVAIRKKSDEILKDLRAQYEKTSSSLEKLSMSAITACSLNL